MVGLKDAAGALFFARTNLNGGALARHGAAMDGARRLRRAEFWRGLAVRRGCSAPEPRRPPM